MACVGRGRDKTFNNEDRADLGSDDDWDTEAGDDWIEIEGKDGRDVDNVCGVEWPDEGDRLGVFGIFISICCNERGPCVYTINNRVAIDFQPLIRRSALDFKGVYTQRSRYARWCWVLDIVIMIDTMINDDLVWMGDEGSVYSERDVCCLKTGQSSYTVFRNRRIT